MKTEIHPQYHTDAKVTCACGNIWTIGSTAAEISVELCSNCPPFHQVAQRNRDTDGRVSGLIRPVNLSHVVPRATLPTATAD